jgi:hypothetical protein
MQICFFPSGFLCTILGTGGGELEWQLLEQMVADALQFQQAFFLMLNFEDSLG